MAVEGSDPRFHGVTFKVIDPSMDEKVKDFMWEHYFPDEPLARSLDIKRNSFMDEAHLDDCLKDRSSIAAVDQSGRILAVRLGKVVHKRLSAKIAEWFFYYALKYCTCCCMKATTKRKFKIAFKFGERLDFDVWKFFDEYNCTTIYDDKGLCSARGHGIKGLGGELVKRSEELSKQRGCTHAIAITTGKYSKIAFERQGYTILNTLQYRTFVDSKGEPYLKDTREHTEAVAFIKEY